jgi:putative transposase
MADHKHMYPIEKMSQVLQVSRSGYYRWTRRPVSQRTVENQWLRNKIFEIWHGSQRVYGAPRIHQKLLRQGVRASRPRVARLMRHMHIASRIRRKWVTTTDSAHNRPVVANLLDRNFTPSEIGKVWVSDITYLPCEHGWRYLTTVMDLGDRQILGWSLSKDMSARNTSVAAFKQACKRRAITTDMIFHSDRGIQYACEEFTRLLDKNPLIKPSMSRKGNCWDNAPAESFFKTLKAEMYIPGKFRDYDHARAMVFEFIEIWYNRKRLHSGLGYRTPVEMEELLTKNKAA